MGKPFHRLVKGVDALEVVFRAFSLIFLIRLVFTKGLAAPFELILESYVKGVDFLFGWVGPYVTQVLGWFGWSIQLRPLWMHVLVLMGLYFATVTRIIWPVFKSRKQRLATLLLTLWGVLLAFSAAIAAGSLRVSTTGPASALVMVFPLVGFVLYQLGWAGWLAAIGEQESWWARFRAAMHTYAGSGVLTVIFLMVSLAVFGDRIPVISHLPSRGLVFLFILVLLLALYWLWTGVRGAVGWHMTHGTPKATWWQTFRKGAWWEAWPRLSNTRIGLSMLKSIVIAIVFLIVGAGRG